ncbi:MAG: hypothetical protein AAGF11_17430 [Myxococcota bacterium]
MASMVTMDAAHGDEATMKCAGIPWMLGLWLVSGCGDVLTEISQWDDSGADAGADPDDSSAIDTGQTTSGAPDDPSTDGGSTSTMPAADSGGTTRGSDDASRGSDSSDGSESTSETGSTIRCVPQIVEVLYDPKDGEDQEQWIKLFNDCPDEIDLSDYCLGWGEQDYMMGMLELQGSMAPGSCFIVGGPISNDDNAYPVLDQPIDLDPDLGKSGGSADGIALFFGPADEIAGDTVPADAVIYGGNNDAGLMDAEGDTPDPHVDDAGDDKSIRRTGAQTWEVEDQPQPGLCPPY